MCVSREGRSLACLGAVLRDSRTESCSFCCVTAAENAEALGAIETISNVVLYVYYMHQTRFGTNIAYCS